MSPATYGTGSLIPGGSALNSSSSVAADRWQRPVGPPLTDPAARTAASSATTNEHAKPRPPAGYEALDFAAEDAPRLTHYLFRFPAKFHPRIAHSLLRSYTESGQTVLDPFCGSGTLLVAAAVEGRNAIGTDIDPVAAFVSSVKTHRYRSGHLRASWTPLRSVLNLLRRSDEEYDALKFDDISLGAYESTIRDEQLWVPAIPHLAHWFRRYVIVDLARILGEIENARIPSTHRQFFRLVFASTIRNASNADPVPVSGLEVTAHMKAIDHAGRVINPFNLMFCAVEKAILAAGDYSRLANPSATSSVLQVDATSLRSRLRRTVDAIITSPPYHNAVDYYRRHQLEMFWLRLTETQADRLALLPKYLGRSSVRKHDPALDRVNELGCLAAEWHERIRQVSTKRADAFVHYMVSMKDALTQMNAAVRETGHVILVLGHSAWNGSRIPTSTLFEEIGESWFDLEDKLWYPTKNRYMSYRRHNGANINEEYVLVFRRRSR